MLAALFAFDSVSFVLAGGSSRPAILDDVDVDVVRICYLFGQAEVPGVDSARCFLLEVELDGLALHDGGAEDVGEFLFALAELKM
jgi:hypothetical protein